MVLHQKSFSSPPTQSDLATQAQARSEVETRTLTHIEQTMNHALEVTAKVTRLMLEPDYQDHLLKHPDDWELYKELGVYATILNFILQSETNINTDIEQSMVEKIVQKCQETTRNVEGFLSTIKIDTSPEIDAALEHLKQMPWNA